MKETVEELYNLLKTIAPTYPDRAPENTENPVIVYSVVSNTGNPALCGMLTIDYVNLYMQIDYYTGNYGESLQKALEIKQVIEVLKPMILSETFSKEDGDYRVRLDIKIRKKG